jgi:hypothetical protein
MALLTFKQLCLYLSFIALFLKTVLLERDNNLELNKQNFMGNKTNYAVCVKNAVYFIVA